ncbi:hypothetical protein F2P81_020605 [Scophthalmus maximus]|uniref:Uncharacterized protein n=1 Tax=Scophthalmus maximus TaxID=52904 RepID=A0A6A4SAQ9_SCOMX|nr:hypothetical protein F2P81_020605 [Scophthalmus maximus]
MTSVAAEFDHMEIQQQYSDGVNNRWDADDWDNENSSARLFERSRIKALADVRVSARREMSRWFVTFYNNTEEKVFSKHADVKNSNAEHQDTFRLKTPEVIKVEEKLLRDVLEP